MRTRLIVPLLAIALLATIGFTPEPASRANSWSVDHAHSKIGFKVRHLGISNVRGDFRDYDVSISMTDGDVSKLSASATIQTTSVFTNNDRRDNHLRSPDFFSAEAFPAMTFQRKEVRAVDGNTFELVGDLTIRDVTTEVVLDAEFLGTATMGDQESAGFEASTEINRMDYGLAWNRLTEAGGFVVGHNVEIILELEMVKDES